MSCLPQSTLVQITINMKKLRNFRNKHVNCIQISRNALYNLHELHIISLASHGKSPYCPILSVFEVFRRSWRKPTMFLHYNLQASIFRHVCFQMEVFYVCPLLLCHTLFKERPCIPAMFLIHERKLKETQEELFKVCKARILALKNTSSPLVTEKRWPLQM